AMAAAMFRRACHLSGDDNALGLGCTAALVTDRPKRGDHRFHIATHDRQSRTAYSLTLTKGARDRDGEERVVSSVLLNALAAASGVADRLDPGLVRGEEIVTEAEAITDPLVALVRGEVDAVCREPDGRWRTDAPRPTALLSGSFNPLHAGHVGLAHAAARK